MSSQQSLSRVIRHTARERQRPVVVSRAGPEQLKPKRRAPIKRTTKCFKGKNHHYNNNNTNKINDTDIYESDNDDARSQTIQVSVAPLNSSLNRSRLCVYCARAVLQSRKEIGT